MIFKNMLKTDDILLVECFMDFYFRYQLIIIKKAIYLHLFNKVKYFLFRSSLSKSTFRDNFCCKYFLSFNIHNFITFCETTFTKKFISLISINNNFFRKLEELKKILFNRNFSIRFCNFFLYNY